MLWRSCASLARVKLTLIRSRDAARRARRATRCWSTRSSTPPGAREAVPNTPNPRRNPLVRAARAGRGGRRRRRRRARHPPARRPLRRRPRASCSRTHVPLFCQPPDAERLHADGFTDVRPVYGDAKLGDLLIARTDGRHGTGEIGEQMAPVSGFVLHAPGEPSVYIAGDTILCDEVRAALAEHRPGVVVVNASAARFNERRPDRDGPTTTSSRSPREAPDAHDRRRALRDASRTAPRRAPTCARGSRRGPDRACARPRGRRDVRSRRRRGARSTAGMVFEQDREVEPDRPALEVEEVEPHEVVEVELRAAGDLPQAGDARAARGSASCASPRAARSRAAAAAAGRRATSGPRSTLISCGSSSSE